MNNMVTMKKIKVVFPLARHLCDKAYEVVRSLTIAKA